MKKTIIKLENFRNIIWILLFLSFSQIVLLPFLRNLFLENLYKPFPIKEVNLILEKVCTSEIKKTPNKNSIIYKLCNKDLINYFKKL